jgi:ubiquinone/menaquinone biosynthesis C-methylase UbiE
VRDVESRLRELAKRVGDDWTHGPYYDEAEAVIDEQWRRTIWPLIRSADFTVTVEVAAGHGRNSEKLRHLAHRLYLVDINETNIEFLRGRFADARNIVYVHNDGVSLDGIPDAEATFLYCFDSMVHFDSDVVRAYLREFRRVLQPGGTGFCHYSNYTGNPTGSYRDHPGWRNFMSVQLFEHYATKEGLEPTRSQLIDADALTVFRRSS